MTAAEDAFEFIRSSDGRAMVTRALQRRGLPLGLRDDLVGEIMRRVVAAAAREPIANPAGLATHAAEFAAADLLRGELRRPLPLLPTAAEDDDADVAPAADDTVVTGAALHSLRDALFNAAYVTPARVAVALAYVSSSVEEAPVGPRCPAPVGGAGAREADEWAGLWYGGRHDCFPSDGGDDSPAVRKRRSRAIAQMRAALIDAARQTELVEGDDD